MRDEGGGANLERCRTSDDWREWRRLRAWHLRQRGWSQRDIAAAFGVTEAAVSRWVARAREGGPAALFASFPGGRPRRLTDQDYQSLEMLLAEGATAHGWPNNLWTCGRVARVIQKHFGVRYHPAHVCRILKTRLNWTCQRPVHHHRGRNDAAIQSWVRDSFPRILDGATARGAHLIFVDEAGFMLEPIVRRTYAPRGKTPVHRIGNPHARISAIGAVTVAPSRNGVGLLYGLLDDNLNFHGPTVVQFLQTLRSTLQAPMTVIWDRIPIHDCDDVDAFVAEFPEVAVEPLPPHAPELNPADGVWRYVKFARLANYTPSDLDTLRGKVIQELERLQSHPELLKSFIRFTKLAIDL
jgi:transposase